jgi:hypothetical protein
MDHFGSKKNGWTYRVVGVSHFPVDMLRYDCAWPRDGHAVTLLADAMQRDARRAPNDPFRIELRSNVRTPTVDRWRSFGWYVETV